MHADSRRKKVKNSIEDEVITSGYISYSRFYLR